MQVKVQEALETLNIPFQLDIIQDLDELLERRVSRTPALEIDGEICISGRVPFKAELLELLRSSQKISDANLNNLMSVSNRTEPSHSRFPRRTVSLVQENNSAMKNPITWIVGLDFSAMDRAVIEYTASMAEMLSPEKIYFLHVYPDLDLPEMARAALSSPEIPLDERLTAQMSHLVEQEFPDHLRYNSECMVVEGKPEGQLLRWAHIKSAELMIMGRKKKAGGNGVIPRRVARNAECSILFVPEKPDFQLRTFLVPTDFSAPSARALETAEWISEHIDRPEVFLYHACHLPSSIYYDGLAGSNMVDLLQEAAEEQMEEFKQKYNALDARVIVNANADRSVARTVAETAGDIPVDMIIIGGKGRSGLTGALLGSVTESLIQTMEDLPIWVVKMSHKRESIPQEKDKVTKTRA